MRLSPAQQQSVHRKELTRESSFSKKMNNSIGGSSSSSPNRNNNVVVANPKRMSVAARARAAADLPSGRHTSSGGGGGGGNSGPPRMPASGNAGVTRGKFSQAQVEQMIDDWGKDDTSEEDDDYYYDVTSDSSGGGDNINNNNSEAGYEQYKQSLERTHHHLQYTMSHSPNDPTNDRIGDVVSAERSDTLPTMDAMGMTEEEAEFHYQHHRVSAYSTVSGRANQLLPRGNNVYQNQHDHNGEADDSGGLFASAKSWLQSQRDRLHQLELERQVQDQRRKLVEEGRKQRSMESDRRRRNASAVGNATTNNTLNVANHNDTARAPQAQIMDSGAQPCEIAPSGSFGCMDGSQASGACTEDLSNIPEQGVVVTGMPNLCGFGGIYANQLDDSTDYSGVARLDEDGNVLEIIPSGSLESLEGEVKVCMKVSSPKSTLSGKGMSVSVDIADDDNYQENNHVNDALDANKNNNNNNSNTNYNNNKYAEEEDDEDDPIITFESDVKIAAEPAQDEEFSPSPQILQPSQMKSLIASGALPPSLNFCKWKRLYSLTRDGDSFEQFLRLVGGHDRTVLVVKTTHGRLFGGYADTRWEAKHFRQHSNSFYGSAQACLFRFPNYGSGRREDKISIYKWSGANRYIQLCDFGKRTVAFGGGGTGGGFGLCIEDDFRRGTTGHCSTFENEALCEEGYFDVMDMEVWGFALDYF